MKMTTTENIRKELQTLADSKYQQRHQHEHAGHDSLQMFGTADGDKGFAVALQEGFPCHVYGDGWCQNHGIFCLRLTEFGVVVCHGCFAGALLPVQKHVAFLKDQSHVVLLQCGEPARLHILVQET